MFRNLALSLLWLCLLSVPLRAAAQGNSIPSTASAQVRYEVASIHPSRPGTGPNDGRISFGPDTYKVGETPSNRFDAEAATVGDILDMLNGWQHYRVVGGPGWMRADRYDIHAKADAAIPPAKQRDAVLALLAERFKLSVHRETRDVPTFVLLASKNPGGRKPASTGEEESEHYNGAEITYIAVPMSDFINRLSQFLQSPAIDKTELEGAFDFSINLSAVAPQPEGRTSAERRASVQDRVREALPAVGLKVEERKMPIEITVVDQCERPSEN
jgi:uncharacterized protein (TIGR03435 family)